MAGNNIPFRPGDAIAAKQVASGRPTDANIKRKYGRNPTGPMPPSDSETRNTFAAGYPLGSARKTNKVAGAARRRLGL
jgi:hypothetical protein